MAAKGHDDGLQASLSTRQTPAPLCGMISLGPSPANTSFFP
jgi:hypothetical protein